MIKLINLLAILCLFVSLPSLAQNNPTATPKKKMHGTFFVNWGYHRDSYTKSTIQFVDQKSKDVPHYDFTLHNAKAHDQVDMNDFFHTAPTVPQYILNAGYFFNDKHDLGIEIGWNHLKYVMTDNQVVHMTGNIGGVQYDQDTLVTPGFLHYEHTNGNNYLLISLLKRIKLLSSQNEKHQLSVNFRLGAGGLIPKTYSSITLANTNYQNDGPFRLSGWVVSTGVALRYDFFRYFFFEPSVKGAFVNYTNVKLYESGRANQRFFSAQYILALGFNIPTTK